jgi:hypothetical protein
MRPQKENKTITDAIGKASTVSDLAKRSECIKTNRPVLLLRVARIKNKGNKQ